MSVRSIPSFQRKAKDNRSQISGSSRRTALSDVSVSSTGKRRRNEGKINSEAQHKERLWEDIGKLKGKLTTQKSRCKELVIVKDVRSLRKVVQNMEETYSEAIETVLQLRELLPAEEARKIMEKVEREETEIFKLKKAVVRIMGAEQGSGGREAVERH